MDTPAPAPAAAPLTATDFMGKLTAAFSAKETLVRDNAALTTKVTGLETDLAAAKTAVTEATAAKTAAEGQVAELTTKVTALSTQLTDFCATLGFKPEELAGKDAAALKTAFNSRIEIRASDKLAELGFPSAGLPPAAQSSSTTTDSAKELSYAEFSALPPAQKMKFSLGGGRVTGIPVKAPFSN